MMQFWIRTAVWSSLHKSVRIPESARLSVLESPDYMSFRIIKIKSDCTLELTISLFLMMTKLVSYINKIWRSFKRSSPEIMHINKEVSTLPLTKLLFTRKLLNLSYQALRACFKSYKIFSNLKTWSKCVELMNPRVVQHTSPHLYNIKKSIFYINLK